MSTNYFSDDNDRPSKSFLGNYCNKEVIDKTQECLRRELPWQKHVNKRVYQGEWDVLALRCSEKHLNSHPILQCFSIEEKVVDENHSKFVSQGWVDLKVFNLFPDLQQVIEENFKCQLKSLRFMRLRAGAKILPHTDDALGSRNGEARLHLPITTDANVEFFLAGEKIEMKPGELWYIDASREHWVNNNSCFSRIHLVIDCYVNDWLKNKILFFGAS